MSIFDFFRRPPKPDFDQAVLSQLKKAGSNLSRPHDVEFFLYFPAQEPAEKAAAQIRNCEFQVEVRPGAQGEDWLCFATRQMVPDLVALQEIRRDFTALAESLGGQYDG